jgi:hypothetical protein
MKRLVWLGLLAALACSGGGGPTDPIEENGIIRIRNRSAIAAMEVYISRCELLSWGANRIESPIGAGQSRDFELAPNCYDVRAVATTGEEVFFFDVVVTRGNVAIVEILDG